MGRHPLRPPKTLLKAHVGIKCLVDRLELHLALKLGKSIQPTPPPPSPITSSPSDMAVPEPRL